MRGQLAWGAVALGVLLTGVWFGRERTGPAPGPAPDEQARGSARDAAGVFSEAPVIAPAVSVAAELPRPTAEATARESEDAARAKIETLMVAYDASALPGLAGYLAHPSAEVRVMAREGIVQLGAAEGAPLLRAAADKATDPREAVALLDAADFLDLPPAEFARRASRKPAR